MLNSENNQIDQKLPKNITDKLRKLLSAEDFNRFESSVKQELNKPPKIAVIGRPGVGKSSTVNALFNLQEAVSHVADGTTEPIEKPIKLPEGGMLSIIDMPGLGADIESDKKYREMYKKVLPEVDIVLYVIQGNLKGFKNDENILKEVVMPVMGDLKGRIVIGLNQVDKIGDGKKDKDKKDEDTTGEALWNDKFNYPSPKQEVAINRRCNDIQNEFIKSLDIEIKQVEYYSAKKRYRIYQLLAAIIKSAGNVGWKFSINPADPIDLVTDERVRDFLRQELENGS
ncbi:GTPase family protein [Nostoc sp. UHCC 0252]|uniref:GTPase family protein n=1 Tax=Nostoc sp. UHCC 0252 TaxID=3110241 RepID=UPI002B20278F|nr:GTPase [Nostoc sp. UHCC 0252]MEA5603978.1 GTPase [Nostoc sp. UHCC 0252]